MYLPDRTLDFHRAPSEHICTAQKFKKADSEEELREVYKLRYKVYCEERGFEKPEDHPGGIEFDEFDKSSKHFMAMIGTRRHVIGTARIILNSENWLPIKINCKIEKDLSSLDHSRLGEISRLAVSNELLYNDAFNDKRMRQMVVFGLYKLIYIESRMMGLTHWLAVMTDGLYKLLRRAGIVFAPIGPPVNYHGIRTPYLGSIAEIEAEVSRKNPELFKATTEELKLLLH